MDGWIWRASSQSFPPILSSVLEFESVYLEELPNATQYERSYMHRDVISHVVVTK